MDNSVASANEVANAISNQDVKPKTNVKTRVSLDIGDLNWDKVLGYVLANKTLGLPTIVKNLESKYAIKAVVKKELSKHIK